MFKLQRLEITGFKSFADYTEIVFTGNGITAVVGPNGCGKSNVSDCISWVLGEQRAKSLRGGEMKDVIFQGSRNRKPGGMAEVVLHLVRDEDAADPDEEDLFDIDEALGDLDDRSVDVSVLEGKDEPEPVILDAAAEDEVQAVKGEAEVGLVRAAQAGSLQTLERTVKTKRHWRPRSVALDFGPGEAVSVTRRLYLSGESEYQLNGRNCRLRDIQDLFAGTGLSGAHYAIVEQGRIGQILSAKPSDRRSLIEEAAGISKFRTRQRAAEARLESAKSNLSRISDIVTEIDKQANSLRRQAGKTRRFIALQEEFRIRLRELFAAEGRYYSGLLERLRSEYEQAAAAETKLSVEVSEKEIAFRESTEGARAAEESLAGLRREHSNNALERDRTEREHRYLSEQVVALDGRLQALRSDNLAVDERTSLAESEIERLRKEEEQEAVEADLSRTLLADAETKWSEKVDTAKSLDDELNQLRGTLIHHTAALERFAEINRQLTLNSERLQERRSGLQSEFARADLAIKEHTEAAVRLRAEVAGEKKKLEGLNGEKAEVNAVVEGSRRQLGDAEQALAAIRDEYSGRKHRLETLRELEESKAVYFPQVQRLFAEKKEIGVELNGVLADLLTVDEKAERAVEALFANFLQAVIVGSREDEAAVSTWVRDKQIGRVAVLAAPREAIQGPRARFGRSGTISGAIEGPKEILEFLNSTFPREMAAELVSDIRANSNEKGTISIDHIGEMSFGGRLFVGGFAATEAKNTSLLAFKRELSGLGQAVSKLEKKISEAEADVNKKRSALSVQEEKIVDLQSLIIKVERGLDSLELQEKTNEQDIERSKRHATVVRVEIEQLDTEAEQIQVRQNEALAAGEKAEELRASVSGDTDAIAAKLSAARAEAENAFAAVNEKRTLAATSGERRRSVQFAIKRLENEVSELENRRGTQNLEAAETVDKIGRIRESIEKMTERIGKCEAEIADEEVQLTEAIGTLGSARTEADKASADLAELNRRSADAINARSAVEVRQTEALTELRNLNEKCLHELNQPLAEVAEEQEIEVDFDLPAARALAEDQRQRLESFGAINMLAVEELTEAEERLDFLTSQRQDIIDSIGAAEEALREIKVRSRTRFKEAFEAINANFTQFFVELFGGGRGEMSLLESDDILEAGIEIVAQPPGKRLQNILLLSGGEKAMTAIALVLAIFKYRPSPFCLLDEVDAPLDDANVGRFVTKIAEMSEKTQFIVITHNKRTMEAARALYGVTMQEAGVSKIVSVKFD